MMRFKGKHQDKRRIRYKAEGDDFQADALCDVGFTYQVYMQNDPLLRKYRKMGLSPLHSCCMVLCNLVEDEYHKCWMDNLYNRESFCKKVFNHKKKVIVSGVTRKGMRGIPSCVKQELVKNRASQRHV